MRTSFFIFALIMLLPQSAPLAWGAQAQSHDLSISSGLASPSSTSALFENPAGLIQNESPSFYGSASSPNKSLNPVIFGAGLFTGNKSVGGGLLLDGINGPHVFLDWGAAAAIDRMNLSVGLSGTFALEGGGGFGAVNLGAIFNQKGATHIGAKIYDVFGGVDALGAGIAHQLSQSAIFALDGAYSIGSKSTVLEPGLSFLFTSFSVTAGYGFRVQGSGGAPISTGFAAGLGIPFGSKNLFSAYYNHLSQYYAALSIGF